MARQTILDEVVPARAPWGRIVKAGQLLRITDLQGCQAVDFLCYNANDREERYSAPNTVKAAGTLSLGLGHTLYSDLANGLLRIVGDTHGAHDTIGGCCSAPSNLMLYGVRDVPGCRENFLNALSGFGMGRRDIVPNVNFFMGFAGVGGDAAVACGGSAAGSYVELEALMDVLAIISNCPQVHNPANNFNPTPIRITISQ